MNPALDAANPSTVVMTLASCWRRVFMMAIAHTRHLRAVDMQLNAIDVVVREEFVAEVDGGNSQSQLISS